FKKGGVYMMNKLRTKGTQGFTLIELMIVIAIIGILAAIAVPNFNRARAQAKKKSCVANMKTIEGAVELYQMENGTVDSLKPADLATKGYLKTEPKCPSDPGPSYDIAIGKGGAGAAVMTDVECKASNFAHGKLSLQETTNKTMGL
ncbi:MAG TPA: prepilin-type N-terminal cleavage/methylation domain-containing protein, partial [Candidatus Wallbacteria bacterium]|nr:prepilin-type N-terminal cleavage/methylation domain-containing protein [Candidatus Wallbacteria bacterium]